MIPGHIWKFDEVIIIVAAILKNGRIHRLSVSYIVTHIMMYVCTNFGAFFIKCTIRHILGAMPRYYIRSRIHTCITNMTNLTDVVTTFFALFCFTIL